MESEAALGVSLPKLGKNPRPAFCGLIIHHVTPIFYCLISYVYCLIPPAATWHASFLCHLTSFVCCLLPIVQRSRVYCLPSALFCHISVLLWLHQLGSWVHHHHMATVVATTPFYGKINHRDDVTAFSNVLGFLGLRLSLSKPNTWFQKTNSSDGYAAGLFFTSFDVRFLFLGV